LTGTPARPRRDGRGRLGGTIVLLASAGVAVATYLSVVKLGGGTPDCSIVAGCDVVNDSEHSMVLGVPVAVLGAIASLVTLAGGIAWWRSVDRRGLLLAYGIGLASLPVLAWLTWLELAVIGAICVWCVAYALLVVGGWMAATLALVREPRRSEEDGPWTDDRH
jgi:uncharacterized membrane protein